MRIFTSLTLLTALAFQVSTPALDWPQWGGPDRDHVSDETGLLESWPAGGPQRLWLNQNAGLGYAGLAIAKGKILTLGARDNAERLIALNESDGKELWVAEVGSVLKNNWGDGPRGTPTIHGDQVFALGGQGTLVAANLADGKILWKVTMQDLGGKVPNWGYTESVLVDSENVYCTPGGDKGAIAALDRKTGKVKWQSSEFTDPAQYTSLRVAEINGKAQLVQLTMKSIVGIDKANGKLLWRAEFPGATAVIPSPVVRNDLVYVTAGYGVGSKLVRVTGRSEPEEVYFNKVMKNHHGGVVLIGDHVYGYSDGPGWVCQNFKTGEEVWASKKLGKGAITAVGKRLYCLDERSGTLVLAEASPSGWTEHGRFQLEAQSSQRASRGAIWMHPVIANGKLYLRDQEMLSCYDVRKK
jgi:outer membrane protein assembly factor BamB